MLLANFKEFPPNELPGNEAIKAPPDLNRVWLVRRTIKTRKIVQKCKFISEISRFAFVRVRTQVGTDCDAATAIKLYNY